MGSIYFNDVPSDVILCSVCVEKADGKNLHSLHAVVKLAAALDIALGRPLLLPCHSAEGRRDIRH